MKKLVLVLIFLMSVSFVSALCEEWQININTASKTELEELYLIGPVKAQSMIDARPLNSVEEILDIYGIGEKTLEGIIAQGLACVDVEVKEIEKEEPEKIVEEVVEEENGEEGEDEGNEIITLTAKTIKSQDNKKDQSNYAIYGFVAFCVLLGILFIIKNKKYKNEFR